MDGWMDEGIPTGGLCQDHLESPGASSSLLPFKEGTGG